jgi:hypothetical protein
MLPGVYYKIKGIQSMISRKSGIYNSKISKLLESGYYKTVLSMNLLCYQQFIPSNNHDYVIFEKNGWVKPHLE